MMGKAQVLSFSVIEAVSNTSTICGDALNWDVQRYPAGVMDIGVISDVASMQRVR